MENFILRPYQEECVKVLLEKFGRGKRSLLISVPTGGGKTVIFNSLILRTGWRTLVVAHREELLEQAINKYLMLGGKPEEVGIIKAGEWKEGKYTVASIQTLHRNLDRINPSNYDLIVIDETHHATAPTYEKVWKKFLESGVRLLGVTATPYRADDESLLGVFEELAYAVDILDLIRDGYLVPVTGKVIRVPVNMKELTRRKEEKDFSVKVIEELFSKREVEEKVVKSWFEHAEGRKTILYASTLKHAHRLAQAFINAGVPALCVDGKMSAKKRQEIISRFKEGRLKVLVNVDVLTEGFDDPSVECIMTVRPTKSLPLYVQIMGRGLRPAPKKRGCLVLDVYGIGPLDEVMGFAEAFGLPDAVKEKMLEGLPVSIYPAEEGEERKVSVYVGEIKAFSFDGDRVSEYATVLGDSVIVSCGLNGKSLVLKGNGNLYDLYLVQGQEAKVIRRGLTEDYGWTTLTAVWEMERDGFMDRFKDVGLYSPATEKQLSFLRKGIERGFLPKELEERLNSMSKLEASNLLAYLFATVPARKLFSDVIIKAGNGGLYFEGSGLPARLSHASVLTSLGYQVSLPSRGLRVLLSSGDRNFLERWLFAKIPDLSLQLKELYYVPKGQVLIPFEWIERFREEGSIEEFREWLKERKWRVKKKEDKRLYLFIAPDRSLRGLEELFSSQLTAIINLKPAEVEG